MWRRQVPQKTIAGVLLFIPLVLVATSTEWILFIFQHTHICGLYIRNYVSFMFETILQYLDCPLQAFLSFAFFGWLLLCLFLCISCFLVPGGAHWQEAVQNSVYARQPHRKCWYSWKKTLSQIEYYTTHNKCLASCRDWEDANGIHPHSVKFVLQKNNYLSTPTSSTAQGLGKIWQGSWGN